MSLSGAAHAPETALARRCRPLLGTFVEIAADRLEFIEAGFEAIATVHTLMSAHQPGSDLSRLNRCGLDGPVPLHPWTAAVLRRALHWSDASDGAFDPTLGGGMQTAGLIPRHPGQPEPDPQASWRDVALDGDRARLRRACVVDLGGIAKGFAVDRAVWAMTAAGASRGLVNAGGDLFGFGDMNWTVTAASPRSRRPTARLRVRDAAVATSALLPGRRGGAHLPRRGRSWSGATVVAASAMDADALTKVVLAGGPQVSACLRSARARAFRFNRSGEWERVA